MTTGWKLDPECRALLLGRFPPRYETVVADHVTRRPFHGPNELAPPPIASARVVGHADDGEGVEALVVALDGATQRPDGGTWHITWSLGPGRSAKESNALLERGWHPLEGGSIALTPAVW